MQRYNFTATIFLRVTGYICAHTIVTFFPSGVHSDISILHCYGVSKHYIKNTVNWKIKIRHALMTA